MSEKNYLLREIKLLNLTGDESDISENLIDIFEYFDNLFKDEDLEVRVPNNHPDNFFICIGTESVIERYDTHINIRYNIRDLLQRSGADDETNLEVMKYIFSKFLNYDKDIIQVKSFFYTDHGDKTKYFAFKPDAIIETIEGFKNRNKNNNIINNATTPKEDR